jgi:hypothetical protein
VAAAQKRRRRADIYNTCHTQASGNHRQEHEKKP